MKLNKKYTVLMVVCGMIIGFTRMPYAKELTQTIKTINEDRFTPQMREELEKLSEADMQDFLQKFAKHQHDMCPIKTSDDDIVLDLVHKGNKLTWFKKTNYDALLNLQNIKQNKEKLTRILTDGMIKDTCSQKLMNFLVMSKDISVGYKFNDWNMKLVDDIVVDKKSCINWNKTNKTYTFVNGIFTFFN